MSRIDLDFDRTNFEDGDECRLASFSFPDGLSVSSVDGASAFSRQLYQLVDVALRENFAGSEKWSEEAALPLRTWSHKKAVSHVQEVAEMADGISGYPEFKDWFVKSGADMQDVKRIVMVNAWLHDIGRQGEIDFSGMRTIELGSKRGKRYDHAYQSYRILLAAGVRDPRILLPVRYHGVMNYRDEIERDDIFKKMSAHSKEEIIRHIDIIRDSDKAANLIVKSKRGMEGVSEINNPKYLADYGVSPESVEGLVSVKGCLVSGESHRLDAMVRWLSWGDQFVYSVPSVVKLIDELWDRTFEEAEVEYANSKDKDKVRYQKTVDTLKAAREKQMARLAPKKGTLKFANVENREIHK